MMVLRREDVCERLKISPSALARMRKQGKFPDPVEISEGVYGWRDDEFNAWLASRPAVPLKTRTARKPTSEKAPLALPAPTRRARKLIEVST